MRRVLFRFPFGKFVLLLTIFVSALTAQANPVSFTFESFTHSKTLSGTLNGEYISKLYMGNINISFTDTDGSSTADVVAYCMEISEALNVGQSYSNYAVSSLTSAGLTDAQARLVAILYDLYYTGSTTQDWNSVNTSAFQLALWELTHDSDGSLWSEDGSFYVDGSSHIADVADSYLESVYALSADSSYTPYSELVALTAEGSQDLIVLASLVPGYEGGDSVAIPFGVNPLPGLAIVGLFVWRRMNKRRV